ncbi:MAG: hypothetical protein CMI08_13360 [Oceanospirillaceae bacterium]|uniref:hypothetical protein n=1 Tax=unclassified Thalassolituus TaxID=2624967 RepID=UPI000C479545|nr:MULTISPECIES: hypothetical protein [unclassified Thalassolituus]MAS24556.1 hypothetical protein [Oceanospirillaceae bacterium]MAY00160.1 hypothetical protein [Oceanospirillaceae bacterium]MBL33928.1 hypothetical protein [Oceanospirillaceae bacterium]MBS54271.1 hypothetical protein [Oceanospirillaceae bacterium]|tara:strand:+ start:9115 stop:9657 length:543 start_codon:yes stop_codon:yes gene_type:complete
MNALRRWLGHPLPAVIFLLIYIVSQTLIARTLQAGNAEALLFQFQFSYSAAEFNALLNSISAAQLNALQQHFAYDHIHPVWYGLLALSLTSWLMNLNELSPRWSWLLLPAILMAALDVVENSIHEPWLQLQSQASDPWTLIAGVAATSKWSLAAIYLAGALLLTARYFFVVRRHRGQRLR